MVERRATRTREAKTHTLSATARQSRPENTVRQPRSETHDDDDEQYTRSRLLGKAPRASARAHLTHSLSLPLATQPLTTESHNFIYPLKK